MGGLGQGVDKIAVDEIYGEAMLFSITAARSDVEIGSFQDPLRQS